MPDAQVMTEMVTTVDGDLLTAIDRMLPQLSERARVDEALLHEVVASPATTLFVARLDGEIVGMCTIAVFTIPTGVRAWIEDVVVDDSARRGGVGTALVNAALEHARSVGARSVELTSRPAREGANRLYQRLGFSRRETNVYRFDLTD